MTVPAGLGTFPRYCRGLFLPPARHWPRAVLFATRSHSDFPNRMTRHPTARRAARPAPAEDDKFVAGVLESTVWAREHARTLVIAAIVLVALVVGFLIFRSFGAAKEAGATTALNDLRATVSAGNAQLALRDGQTLLAQYGGTEAASEARVLMAQLYLQASQPSEAADVIAPVAGEMEAPLGFNAAMLLGAAYEAAGQSDEANQVYRRVGAEARFQYQQIAGYEEAARIQTAAGDVEGAIASYERILDLLDENAPQRGIYEMRLTELQVGGANAAAAAALPTAPAAPATSGAPTAPGDTTGR